MCIEKACVHFSFTGFKMISFLHKNNTIYSLNEPENSVIFTLNHINMGAY